MELAINSAVKYLTDTGHDPIEKVLWICRESDQVAMFELGNGNALPIMRKLSEIEELVASGNALIVSYNNSLLLHEEQITQTQIQIRDSRWELIKDIVTCEPDVFFPHERNVLIEKVMSEKKVTRKSLYKFMRKYWSEDKTVDSLLPAFHKIGCRGQDKRAGEKKRGAHNSAVINIDAKEKETIIIAYKEFHLDKKLSVPKAHQRMLEKYYTTGYYTNEQGNLVPAIKEIVPTIRQFRYWGRKTFSAKEHLISQLGEREYSKNHRPVLGETTTEAFGPGRRFQIDATIADIYLVSRLNSNWIIGRPVVYMVIDTFSRRITGFYVGVEGPSWLGAMMALYNVTRNKVELCSEFGITISEEEWDCNYLPDSLIVDRGELESTKPQNLIKNLKVDVKILPPYKADWKGIVEQNFRRFNNQTIHWLEKGVVKREYRIRGEEDYRLGALLNLYEFTQIIIYSILYFNNKYMDYYERDEQMIKDNVPPIPNEIWKWGIKNRSGALNSFSEEKIKLNLMPSRECSINYRGLQFQNRRYSCPEFLDSGLYEHIRKYGSIKKIISYDPRNEEYVYVNDGDKFLKLTLLDDTKRNMYYEEIDCLRYFEQKEKSEHKKKSYQSTAELNANIDAVINNAKKNHQEANESKSQRVKNIRKNRSDEREVSRNKEAWELDKKPAPNIDSKVIPLNDEFDDDEYIPKPTFTNLVSKNFKDGVKKDE